MKKIFLILSALVMLEAFSSSLFGQNKFSIITENKDSVNYYDLKEFYFVHQLFSDVFYRTDIYRGLDNEEMAEILQTMLYKIDAENTLTLKVKQEKGPDAVVNLFISEDKDGKTVLVMTSNYDYEAHKYLKNFDENKCLTRWYYIIKGKLIYHGDIYSVKTEKEKKSKSPCSLIDLYLLDDNAENDAKIKGLIDEIINNKNSEKKDVLYAKMYLLDYYMLNDDFESAEKEKSGLIDYFEKYKNNGISPQYLLITKMAETEYEILKYILNK